MSISKPRIFILAGIISLIIGQVHGQSNRLKFGGYGEILYQKFDYGANQRLLPTGSKSDNRSIIDIPRFVLKMEYHFTDDIYNLK